MNNKNSSMINDIQMNILENLFGHEINQAFDKKLLPLSLSEEDSKDLIKNGYIEERIVVIKGNVFKFHRLTWFGHMTYCMNCKDEPKNEQSL